MSEAPRSLTRRALPLSLALGLFALAGLLTDTIATSQVLALVGPSALSIIYPISGVLMAIAAAVQFTFVDSAARLKVLRVIGFGYGLAFLLALTFLWLGSTPAIAIAAVWLLGDQVQLLMPMLLWALAGDIFNTTESKKVYSWILTWTFASQLIGLAVVTVAPFALQNTRIPLTALLVFDPIVCLALAAWLPRRMRGEPTFAGTKDRQHLGPAVREAVSFFHRVRTWRGIVMGVVVTTTAAVLGVIGFSQTAEYIIGDDAGTLQSLLGGVQLAILLLCWVFQIVVVERLAKRMTPPGMLLILPIITIVSGLVLAVGASLSSIPLTVASMIILGVPTWTIADSARQTALTLIPDHLRARTSFIIDLGRTSFAQIVAGGVAFIGVMLGWYWLTGILIAVIAAIALVPSIDAVRTWDSSMLSWRLRRRKHAGVADMLDWGDGDGAGDDDRAVSPAADE